MSTSSDDTGSRRFLRNPFIDGSPTPAPPDPVPGESPTAPPEPAAPSGVPAARAEPVQRPLPVFGRAMIDVDGESVFVADLPEFDFAAAPQEPERLEFRLRAQADGRWQAEVSWPAWTGDEVAVYRVIAADGEPPQSLADNLEATLDVTTRTSIIDSTAANPQESGVRFYEVWLYRGRSVSEAVAQPPFLYAGVSPHDRVVWPPTGLAVTPSGRDLVVSWDALPDQAFRLKRLTRSEARRGRPARTECDAVPAGGHLDADVPAGETFVYFLYAGVMVDGQQEWSQEPATARAELPVTLASVLDLRVEPRGESRVDLVWSSVPTGKVEIYTTSRTPPADLDTAGQLSREALRDYPYNLDLESRMAHPVVPDADGRSRMANVDVSVDTAAVYFVPITVHGSQARPGRPSRWLRAAPPSNLTMVDRVQNVLVAFRWPRGAARVDLWITPENGRPNLDAPAHAKLSREDYDTYGGFLIDRERFLLPSGVHDLHLAGYISHGEEGKHSPPTMIRASFPALVRYKVVLDQKTGAFRGTRTQRRVLVGCFETLRDVTFELVWHESTLPMSLEDGRVLYSTTTTLHAREPRELEGVPDLPESGYVRLVAGRFHEPPIALLDPSVSQLRLGRG